MPPLVVWWAAGLAAIFGIASSVGYAAGGLLGAEIGLGAAAAVVVGVVVTVLVALNRE